MVDHISSGFREGAPEWLRKLDLSPDTLGYHMEHPEPPPGRYIREQHLALGAKVLAKRRVYLDQNYWNYCRDAARGAAQHPLHEELYALLQDGVSRGLILCPASHLVFEETLKQDDPKSRDLTARVIQDLSTGVSLQPPPVLAQLEVLYFLYTSCQQKDAYAPEQLAWTYIANLLGHPSPVLKKVPPGLNNAIQKAWFDSMARFTFTTLVEAMSGSKRQCITPDYYEIKNEQCALYRNDFSSFKEVFLIEIAGVLDAYKPLLLRCQLHMFERMSGKPAEEVESRDADDCARMLSNLIYHAFGLNRIDRELPCFRIMAGIHAAIRHKGQKHRPGDLHDHLHARAALPYCDVLLTERTLGSLLCHKPLEFDKLYGCRVEWTPEAAVQAVRGLLESGK